MKPMRVRDALAIYAKHGKHNVIALSFTYKGMEYVVSVKEVSSTWCYWQKHRNKYNLRMSLNNNTKRKLVKTAGCMCLGNTTDIFTENSKYNKGDQIEAYLKTMITGKAWHKDFTPWYEGADIESGSMRIQVKRENATICSLSSLKRFATA